MLRRRSSRRLARCSDLHLRVHVLRGMRRRATSVACVRTAAATSSDDRCDRPRCSTVDRPRPIASASITTAATSG